MTLLQQDTYYLVFSGVAQLSAQLSKKKLCFKRGTLFMIGDRIKQLRGEESQAAFGARFGISRSTVMRYESEERKPDSDFIAAMCRKYNVNAQWLITGEGSKYLGPGDISYAPESAQKAAPASSSTGANQIVADIPRRRATDIHPSHTQIPQWENPDPEMFYYVMHRINL